MRQMELELLKCGSHLRNAFGLSLSLKMYSRPSLTLQAALLMIYPQSRYAESREIVIVTEKVTVLLEAEAFEDLGGWVIDQQFMDLMGSPFLLAHGLGRPVPDAVTHVHIPHGDLWRVWARTRDWVAMWNAPGTPGKFQILFEGRPCETVFGTEGVDWHWQYGGTVHLLTGELTVALHDLTGFEGRCDAIILSDDPDFTPPEDPAELEAFRRAALSLPARPDSDGEFDLVVVGGGIAGMCAALAAARGGLEVALVTDRPVLGGANSSDVRVWLGGEVNLNPYPRIGDIVAELEPAKRAHSGPENSAEIYEDAKRIDLLRNQKGLKLWLGWRVNDVETADGSIRSVIAQEITTGRRMRLAGRWFADCTGDGGVGFLAGAEYDITLEGHMGPTNIWHVRDTGSPAPFPRCPWAVDLSDKPFPGRKRAAEGAIDDAIDELGSWPWENGFDRDPIADAERIRDMNLRAMYGAWDAMKNADGVFETYELGWAAYIAGKRESRRLMGDVILSGKDVLTGREFEDACFPCTWSIDCHFPHPDYVKGFEDEPFIGATNHIRYPTPYWAPYRCLYSRHIDNLFLAGRDISTTHEALGTTRVMRTCGAMGEVVGLAARICKAHEASPRDVYESHLEELKGWLAIGAGKHARI